MLRNKMTTDDLSYPSKGLNVRIANHWLKLSSEAMWKFYCEKRSPSPPLPFSLDTHWPRTCCSRLSITLTACCSMINLVCGFSLLRWSWHMWPSSLKAPLMSLTRSRSRVLFANLRAFSRSALTSTGRSSSSSSSSTSSRLLKGAWQMRKEGNNSVGTVQLFKRPS